MTDHPFFKLITFQNLSAFYAARSFQESTPGKWQSKGLCPIGS